MIHLDMNNIKIGVEENAREILVNSELKSIDNAPFNSNGNCYLPIRNILNELGLTLFIEDQVIRIYGLAQ